MDAYFDGMRRYVDFTGRATRAQFWQFVLVVGVLLLLALFIDRTMDLRIGLSRTVLGFLVGVAHFLPFVAISVRRLHDTDRSGLWYLLNVIPLGVVPFIVLACIPSTPGVNRYGPAVGANAPGASLNHSMPTAKARRHLEPLFDGHWQQVTPPHVVQAAKPTTDAPSATGDALIERLERLASLRAAGTIDDTEFQSMKAKLLIGTLPAGNMS